MSGVFSLPCIVTLWQTFPWEISKPLLFTICVVSEHWSSKIRSNKYLCEFETSSHLCPMYCWDRWWVNAKWPQSHAESLVGLYLGLAAQIKLRPDQFLFVSTHWTRRLGLMYFKKLECGIRIKISDHGHISKELRQCSYQESSIG